MSNLQIPLEVTYGVPRGSSEYDLRTTSSRTTSGSKSTESDEWASFAADDGDQEGEDESDDDGVPSSNDGSGESDAVHDDYDISSGDESDDDSVDDYPGEIERLSTEGFAKGPPDLDLAHVPNESWNGPTRSSLDDFGAGRRRGWGTVSEKDLTPRESVPAAIQTESTKGELGSYQISSIFPDGGSVLYFPGPDELTTLPPDSIRSRLILRSCKYTPSVVKDVVTRLGFKITKGPALSSKEEASPKPWLVYWGRHVKAEVFQNVEPWQTVNHAPNTFEIGRKDKLNRSLGRMFRSYTRTAGAEPVPPRRPGPSTKESRVRPAIDFLPATYVLPRERSQLKLAFRTARAEARSSGQPEKAVWIVKPPASARGMGIRLVKKWTDLPQRRDVVVSRYVHNPLLVDGRKFDLRLYVLATSFDPLRAYIFEEGLARFASEKYQPPTTRKSMRNKYMHLTNCSLNKKNIHAGDTLHKWSLAELKRYFRSKQVDSTKLFERIHQIIIKTLLSATNAISSSIRANCRGNGNFFELFGFDILLDNQYKPWLMEVNISPSLNTKSQLDMETKDELVRGVFNLIGIKVKNLEMENESEAKRLCKKVHDLKRRRLVVAAKSARGCLETLTEDDLELLKETEDEYARRGKFIRLFPSTDPALYALPQRSYHDFLLHEWVCSGIAGDVRKCRKFLRAKQRIASSLPILFRGENELSKARVATALPAFGRRAGVSSAPAKLKRSPNRTAENEKEKEKTLGNLTESVSTSQPGSVQAGKNEPPVSRRLTKGSRLSKLAENRLAIKRQGNLPSTKARAVVTPAMKTLSLAATTSVSHLAVTSKVSALPVPSASKPSTSRTLSFPATVSVHPSKFGPTKRPLETHISQLRREKGLALLAKALPSATSPPPKKPLPRKPKSPNCAINLTQDLNEALNPKVIDVDDVYATNFLRNMVSGPEKTFRPSKSQVSRRF